jgi:VWFA-related protein
MNNTLSFLVLSAVVCAVGPQTQAPGKASDVRTRNIYVSVVDGDGNAVKGLTAADFSVREEGTAREVLRVGPATGDMDIILLVDDSQAATTYIPYLRDGLTRFIERMGGKARIGIVTIGERPTNVVERTNDVAALKKGIGRIFSRSGTGAYLLEGIVEVSRGMQMRETARPVIIALTTEGVEYSNMQGEQVIKELHAGGATFHAIAIGTPAASLSDEVRNRNIVLAEGTRQTGGRREQLLSEMAIPTTLEELADELLNQYVVTYGRPDALIPPEKVQVTVNKPGVTARARTRLPVK